MKGLRLLNVGNFQHLFHWQGDFSRHSSLWTPDLKDLLKPDLSHSTPSFWLTFDDFIREFSFMDVCRVRNWAEARIRGRFLRIGDEDSVLSKWVYTVEANCKSHAVISVHQEDERIGLPRRPLIDVGLALLRLDKDHGTELVMFKDYQFEQNLECECILEPGHYMIIPKTTGCHLKRPDNA